MKYEVWVRGGSWGILEAEDIREASRKVKKKNPDHLGFLIMTARDKPSRRLNYRSNDARFSTYGEIPEAVA